MGIEVALGASNFASVVALGVFLWRVFGARFDSVDARLDKVEVRLGKVEERLGGIEGRVDSLEARFDSLEGRFDGFVTDHHGLARELSEFRGEVRGRLDMAFPRSAVES